MGGGTCAGEKSMNLGQAQGKVRGVLRTSRVSLGNSSLKILGRLGLVHF